MVKRMTEYTLTDIEAMLPHILKREILRVMKTEKS